MASRVAVPVVSSWEASGEGDFYYVVADFEEDDCAAGLREAGAIRDWTTLAIEIDSGGGAADGFGGRWWRRHFLIRLGRPQFLSCKGFLPTT